jgi:anti-sigma B factor antagonist
MDTVAPADLDIPYEESRYLVVSVSRHRSGLAAVLHLEGHLDQDTVPLLRQRVAPLLGQRVRVLVFDMGRLQFLSSGGVGVLLHARRTQTACGGSCAFVNLPPRIRRVFDVLDALPTDVIFSSHAELDRYIAALQHGTIGVREEVA